MIGMRSVATAVALAVVLAGCSSGSPQGGTTSTPGRGAIAIQVVPNPIVARPAAGDQYEFRFEVIVRETGGRSVEITNVSATVLLGGSLQLGRESWNAERIRSMGYSTTVPANGELRYRFSPKKDVPDDRLFGGVSADLRVDAVDDAGAATNATTSVTITR